jgi:hypothetical protein
VQQTRSNMMQQRGKPRFLAPPCGFSYAPQSHATLARHCVRREQGSSGVSLGRSPFLSGRRNH